MSAFFGSPCSEFEPLRCSVGSLAQDRSCHLGQLNADEGPDKSKCCLSARSPTASKRVTFAKQLDVICLSGEDAVCQFASMKFVGMLFCDVFGICMDRSWIGMK